MAIRSIVACILLITACGQEEITTQMTTPPIAKKIDKELEKHEHVRIDPYYWLKDREDPEVIAYLDSENSYTDSMMSHTKEFQESLYQEIIARIKQDDQSVPYRLGDYYYYRRYEKGQEYPLYCRKPGSLEGTEEIILDVNELAKGHEFISVRSVRPSEDHKLIVFGMDTVGRRKYSLLFKDLESGNLLSDKIILSTGSAHWANDNKTVFYTTKDQETLRSDKIWRHELGTDTKDDVMVFEETDDTYSVSVYKSKSKKFLLSASYSTLSREYRYLDANDPTGEFQTVLAREEDHEYSVSHFEDHFYIKTNWEAKNFRLMRTMVGNTDKSEWEEVIPHRPDVMLEGIEIFKDHLVVDERSKGLNQLRIIRWDDQSEHYLDFGEAAYTCYISTNPEFETEILRYGYSSLTTPNSIYDYNMESKEKILLKQQEVVGDFDPANYFSERLMAKARDGTEIPISLVYRKGLEKNGENPVLLYGYGSYGVTIDPYFSSVRLSLLDRGFVFAIAHVRGGQMLGRQWYEDGKLLKKRNTFTDFIDCGKSLIQEGFTSSSHLYAQGGSAGGLLMGAVINMAPETFKGIVAGVPFVDVVTTMLDETIPLTTSEYDEWGNPNNKEYYDYILSYSPYDNVEAKDYPALLVTTGLHDSQVQYWEPAKWVAKLRDLKTDQNLLLLKTDMETGHSGASGRFKQYKETALEYVFLLDLEGITE